MDIVINKRKLDTADPVLICDRDEYSGVIRVAGYAASDLEKVFGVRPKIGHSLHPGLQIVFGTLGRSRLLADLCHEYAVDLSDLSGKRECYEMGRMECMG